MAAEEGIATVSRAKTPPKKRLFGVFVAALIVITGAPLGLWLQSNEKRALSLSNMRRIGLGALFYAEDWDGRLMPPVTQDATYGRVSWVLRLRGYASPDSVFSNPSNPVSLQATGLRDPQLDCPATSSYALNRRFWHTFSAGPFPIENLEIPGQTLLFAESGPTWVMPDTEGEASHTALLTYGDTLDRVAGRCPFPTTHNGEVDVVAADGHGISVKVAHYSVADGPHDGLYGRFGGNIYNWNGGRPNGHVDTPARE